MTLRMVRCSRDSAECYVVLIRLQLVFRESTQQTEALRHDRVQRKTTK